jgi:hypothetical protein
VSRDFCLFKFLNDLPEDVDGDAEKDYEDEANNDESEHPVAQDSPICTKKMRLMKGTIRERLPKQCSDSYRSFLRSDFFYSFERNTGSNVFKF